ncbi:antibiotic biosynthesis monooxygenase [Variovorax boronicumulans]|uniref:antibiotic biosynthesis monooxygenase n=1 Tax=Variovorax boronicumulans TaxID=436515 RepID=UPI0033908012
MKLTMKFLATTLGLAAALACGQASAQAPAGGANAAPANAAGGPVASIVSIYVNPAKQEEFQTSYKQQYAAQTRHPEGVLESYLLAPAAGDSAAPFKHVTIWRDRASYDGFLKKVTSGEHPVGAKTSYGNGDDMYARRPIYELYSVSLRRVDAASASDAPKN